MEKYSRHVPVTTNQLGFVGETLAAGPRSRFQQHPISSKYSIEKHAGSPCFLSMFSATQKEMSGKLGYTVHQSMAFYGILKKVCLKSLDGRVFFKHGQTDNLEFGM